MTLDVSMHWRRGRKTGHDYMPRTQYSRSEPTSNDPTKLIFRSVFHTCWQCSDDVTTLAILSVNTIGENRDHDMCEMKFSIKRD